MPSPAMLPTLFRELLGPRTQPREPESHAAMEDLEQVTGYAQAGRRCGLMAASYLFQTAHICQAIQGCKWVLDLGCGPGTQLAEVAKLNPGTRFVGVDLSERMLAAGRTYLHESGLDNVELIREDMTRLASLPSDTFDGAISTLTLHHLPDEQALRACFRALRRVLRPGGSLYLVDFGRLKSPRSVEYFARKESRDQPLVFIQDYEQSLRAAFQYDELAASARDELPAGTRVRSTFLVPVLTVIETGEQPLPTQTRAALKARYRALPRRYRREVDDMRLFGWLGGLRPDPFR